MTLRIVYLFTLLIVLATVPSGCGRLSGISDRVSSGGADAQKLPFDREPQTSGISPTHSFVPAASKLLGGAPLTVRLQDSLSSASANAGDVFTSKVEEAVVVNGQTAIERGTTIIGRVLASKSSVGRDPGYLRIALVSLDVDGKPVAIDTSSIFARSGSHEKRTSGATNAAVKKEASFDPNQRLTFHLARAVELR